MLGSILLCFDFFLSLFFSLFSVLTGFQILLDTILIILTLSHVNGCFVTDMAIDDSKLDLKALVLILVM